MNAHTPLPLNNGMIDEEIETIILEQMASCDPPTLPAIPTEADLAGVSAYKRTKDWMALYEKERATPGSVEYGRLFDARQRMQDAHRYHGDLVAIERIGEITERWQLRPYDESHFELAERGEADGLMIVPRDLPAAGYRAILQGYRLGEEHGRIDMQSDFRRLLGMSGAVR